MKYLSLIGLLFWVACTLNNVDTEEKTTGGGVDSTGNFIYGTVSLPNEDPASNTTIVVNHYEPNDTGTTILATYITTTDTEGVFKIDSLEAGKYSIYAEDDDNTGLLQDMEYSGKKDSVFISMSEKVLVQGRILGEDFNSISILGTKISSDIDSDGVYEIELPSSRQTRLECIGNNGLVRPSFIAYKKINSDTLHMYDLSLDTSTDPISLQEVYYQDSIPEWYVEKELNSIALIQDNAPELLASIEINSPDGYVDESTTLKFFPMLLRLDASILPASKASFLDSSLIVMDGQRRRLNYHFENLTPTADTIFLWTEIIDLPSDKKVTLSLYEDPSKQGFIREPFSRNFIGAWHLSNKDHYSNTENTSINTGISYSKGYIGNALSFNGNSSTYFTVLDEEDTFMPSPELSLTFWFNIQDLPDDASSTIISKGDIWKLYSPAGENTFSFAYTDEDDSMNLIQLPSFELDTWYHMGITMSDNNISIYVDGELSTSEDYNGLAPGEQVPFRLGGNYAEPESSFNGFIDELSIMNTERSANWIKMTHFNQMKNTSMYQKIE